jgi:hypothetical protein
MGEKFVESGAGAGCFEMNAAELKRRFGMNAGNGLDVESDFVEVEREAFGSELQVGAGVIGGESDGGCG